MLLSEIRRRVSSDGEFFLGKNGRRESCLFQFAENLLNVCRAGNFKFGYQNTPDLTPEPPGRNFGAQLSSSIKNISSTNV